MKNRRRISLGDPFSPGGSTYIVRSQDDLFQMAVDFEYMRLLKEEIVVTPLLHDRIVQRVQREQLLLDSKISSLGIPQKLKDLFEIKSKSEAEKYCRVLRLNEFELFLLIHNCDQINLTHDSRFKEYIPRDRTMGDKDREGLSKRKYLEYAKKLTSLLEFRKQSHIHLFESGGEC